MRKKITFAAAALSLTAACANNSQNSKNIELAASGAKVDLEQEQTDTYRNTAEGVVDSLIKLAEADPANVPAEYKDVARAGMLVIDAACGEYLEALFWLDRGKTHTVAQLGLVNTAATGALGLFGGGADLIAAVGGAFGLATATVENIGESLLFQLEPVLVRDLVRETQLAFRRSFDKQSVTSQVSALGQMAAYAALCKPPSIESEVLRSISGAEAVVKNTSRDSEDAPQIEVAPRETSFKGISDAADSENSDTLRALYANDQGSFQAAAFTLANDMQVVTETQSGAARVFELLTRGDLGEYRARLVARLAP